MRADQFITKLTLLEYRRDVTLQSPALRKRLVEKFVSDPSSRGMSFIAGDLHNIAKIAQIQNSNPERAKQLQNELLMLDYNPTYATIPDFIYSKEIMDAINYDKASNTAANMIERNIDQSIHKYIPWVIREYIREGNDGIKRFEDISDVNQNLIAYELNKRRRGFPQEAKDIMRLTAAQLRAAVRKYDPNDPEGLAYNLGNYEVVYGKLAVTRDMLTDMPKPEIASDVVVIHPKDKTAGIYFGRVLGGTTEWCTAYIPPRTNQFDYYNRQGPMYIIIPQEPKYEGEKYQIHMASDQVMNEDDDSISLSWLLSQRFPQLANVFKKLIPQLNQYVAFADPELITSIWKTVGEIAQQYADEMVFDWETQDEYYHDYVADAAPQRGYVTSNGEIDWDRVHEDDSLSYLNANDSARDFINIVDEVAKFKYNDIINAAGPYEDSYDGDYNHQGRISQIERIFGAALVAEQTGRDTALTKLADTLTTRVDVRKKKETEAIRSATSSKRLWHTVATIGDWLIQTRL